MTTSSGLATVVLKNTHTLPAGPTAEREGFLESILQQVVENKEDGDARISVVRAADRIVQVDVEKETGLKNALGPGENQCYA